MSKHYKGNKRAQKHRSPVSPSDIAQDAMLRSAYTELVQTIQLAQRSAEEQSLRAGLPVQDILDLRSAGRILDQYPQLVRYLDGLREREFATQDAMTRDITKSNPTGSVRGESSGALGGWAGSGVNRNNPIGVHNVRQLRDWADSDEWVNAGLSFLCEKVGRADIAVLPVDERKPYNRKTLKSVEAILDQPNELKDTWPMLVRMFTRDLLTIGQGVFTKNMQVRPRIPLALYCEDASLIKIYPAWNGNPDEPRYLYEQGSSGFGVSKKTPLRNDEAIVAFYNPASYRFGMGAVQVLAETIRADLKATEAAGHMVDMKPPPFFVQFPGASDIQIRNVRANYESEVMGRRQIFFAGGPNAASIHPLIFSARDNQWLEWQEYLVKKVCSVLGISPQDLGMTYQINKATAGSQQEISESKGFLPLLLLIEEYLNREFLADFAPTLPNGRTNIQALNLRIVFPEVSEAARMLHAEKAVDMATKSLAGLPSKTLNQILMMQGEEPIRGGNTMWVMTTNGPMPWLSYDNDFGDYTSSSTTGGELGTQDAGGGLTADDSSNDDMSSPENASENATTETTDGSETAGSTGMGSSSEGGTATTEKRLKTYQPPRWTDTRKPGTRWTHRTYEQETASLPTPIPIHHIGSDVVHHRSHEQVQARQELVAAVRRVFEDIEKKGSTQLREMER